MTAGLYDVCAFLAAMATEPLWWAVAVVGALLLRVVAVLEREDRA